MSSWDYKDIMSILQAIFLGFIQGVTEFLPISSTAHLILVEKLLGLKPSLFFGVALHWGTMAAVIAFFWRDFVKILRSLVQDYKRKARNYNQLSLNSRLGLLILIGTIPAVLGGLLFGDVLEEKLYTEAVIAGALVVVAGLMYWVERKGRVVRNFSDFTAFDALFIGFSQALALIPGVSRSGITIVAGVLRGLNRKQAAWFSFLLATPAIFGAGVWEGLKVVAHNIDRVEILPAFVGVLTSAVFGYAAIAFLLSFLEKKGLGIFIVYRIMLAVFVVASIILSRV